MVGERHSDGLMKAAVFHTPRDVRVETINRPLPGIGEIVIRVWGIGLCTSDIVKIDRSSVPDGTVLGHEVVGVVESVGEGVENIQPGQRVFIAHHVPCFSCYTCLHQAYTVCPTYKKLGIFPGGFAEYVLALENVVKHGTLVLPPELAFQEAIFIEPVACAVRGLKRSGLRMGDTLMIIGAGFMGLVLLQLAQSNHINVVVSELQPNRREAALEMGASAVVDPAADDPVQTIRNLTGGRGADAVITTVVNPRILTSALATVRDGGVINVFGAQPGNQLFEIDPYDWWRREVEIIPSWSYEMNDLYEAMNVLSMKLIDVAPFSNQTIRMEGILDACDMITAGRMFKAIIRVEGEDETVSRRYG